jgi:hypothetical protein
MDYKNCHWCRQLFKDLNMLPVACMYPMKVMCCIKTGIGACGILFSWALHFLWLCMYSADTFLYVSLYLWCHMTCNFVHLDTLLQLSSSNHFLFLYSLIYVARLLPAVLNDIMVGNVSGVLGALDSHQKPSFAVSLWRRWSCGRWLASACIGRPWAAVYKNCLCPLHWGVCLSVWLWEFPTSRYLSTISCPVPHLIY